MTVEAIKHAITELKDGERHSLALWLNELEYDSWDSQMVQDFSPGGRGTALLEKIRGEIAEGKAIPFKEGFAKNRETQDLLP